MENKLYKVLLTGSNGFLGNYLVNYLRNRTYLKLLSRSNSDYNCDLAKDIPKFSSSFDIVIHSAGKAHISLFDKLYNPKVILDVNVNGTINLLKGLECLSVPKKFIYISSVSVYGLQCGININENTPLNSNDFYSRSKIEAENLIIDWCIKNNVKYTILRLPLIVGSNPPGNLQTMINGIKNGYYFNISGKNSKKSMVLASDVARFILIAADVGGIFNLTDGHHPTFSDLALSIANQLGKKKPLNLPFWFVNLFAILGDLLGKRFFINSNMLNKITSDLTFDDSKARSLFGWKPKSVLKCNFIAEQ